MKKSSKKTIKIEEKNRKREKARIDLAFIILLCLAIFTAFCITSLNGVVSEYINPIFSGLLGPIKYILPIVFLIAAFILVIDNKRRYIVRYLQYFFIILIFSSLYTIIKMKLNKNVLEPSFQKAIELSYFSGIELKSGGVLGMIIAYPLIKLFGFVGSIISLVITFIILLIYIKELSPTDYVHRKINERIREIELQNESKDNRDITLEDLVRKEKKPSLIQKLNEYIRVKKANESRGKNIYSHDDLDIYDAGKQLGLNHNINSLDQKLDKYKNAENEYEKYQPAIGQAKFVERDTKKEKPKEQVMSLITKPSIVEDYKFPPISLLNNSSNKIDKRLNIKLIKDTAETIQKVLASFGVIAEVENFSQGPSVTRYELKPAEGVRVNKIAALSDDIALNVAAETIRIEAPIPGKQAVGIEVPNKKREDVSLREVIDSEAFKSHKSKISFALGKGVGGEVVIADIFKMPHLLVAGSTGSGKSVCINTIITSIIYKSDPNEVKFLMVDPKVVELSVYNSIPHLLIPVITEPPKASAALKWAVEEMIKRYNIFAKRKVKDIDGYNEVVDKSEKMPKIIILIDELADLMMAAAKEVEDSICRLAQMGRAAGMHLVIATQRPSVDVITGLIKANIPSRIAFTVSSSIDSRTILGLTGAEKLLGKGDMLYFPIGTTKPIRVQGAFISEKEVNKIVEYIKTDGNVENEISKEIYKTINQNTEKKENEPQEKNDEYLKEALERIVRENKASISMLRRWFPIGDARAGRLMDKIESLGVISKQNGTKPRRVLIDMSQLPQIISSLENNANNNYDEEVIEGYIPPYQSSKEITQENIQEDIPNLDNSNISKVDEPNSFNIERGTLKIDEEYIDRFKKEVDSEIFLKDIISDMIDDDEISVSYLKRKYGIDRERGRKILDTLQNLSMISSGDDSNRCVFIKEFEKDELFQYID